MKKTLTFCLINVNLKTQENNRQNNNKKEGCLVMDMKKVIVSGLALISTGVMLSACGNSGGSSSNGKTEIEFYNQKRKCKVL